MFIQELSELINGEIVGNDNFFLNQDFTGRFTLLNDSKKGDIVIRHWINGKGIEIAASKNIACLITQNPKDGAIEAAEKLNFPLIVTEKIELANAYALKWTVENYSPDSTNVVITGTNGKSTTSHLIYHILNNAGYHVFTNTDSESEFNTLIDPMVSKLISDEVDKNGELCRVSVKTTQSRNKAGNFQVQLKNTTLGADHNTIRKFDNTSCEIVFVATIDGNLYEIPSKCIKATCSFSINEDYDIYKISL